MYKNFTYPIFLVLLFLIPISIFAQPRPGSIQGQVVDSATGNPLEYATISIFSKRDSSIVTGDITNSEGKFAIETRPGRFFAKIEFIGYEEKTIAGIRINRESKLADLGTIELGMNAEVMDEVVVRAEKSTVQMSLDKRVFNVGKDLANAGGTAADILDNVPSVAVDIEGNVSLRGSEGVQILVDGKPSGLIGISGSDGLRNLPANMIDRVEVITNPSAKFEAEGAAGIINIVLRKQTKEG